MTETIQKAKSLIKEKLKEHPKRLAHSFGVAETARKLAIIHHVNPDAAEIAGLMHDYAKYDTLDEQKKHVDQHLIVKYNDHPVIFHAYAAAFAAKHLLHIKDETILSAIACHVWGKPRMTTIEKILFVADFCEPTRPFDDRDVIYDLACHNLDAAVLYCMDASMKDLKKRKLRPSQASLEAYQYYKEVARGFIT